MKFVYLLEYDRVQRTGSQYTHALFVRDKFGPFSAEILAGAEDLQADGIIRCTSYDIDTNCVLNEYCVLDETRAARYDLPEGEKAAALALIAKMATLTLRAIKNLSYCTPPMVAVLKEEARTSRELIGRKLDMTKANRPKVFNRNVEFGEVYLVDDSIVSFPDKDRVRGARVLHDTRRVAVVQNCSTNYGDFPTVLVAPLTSRTRTRRAFDVELSPPSEICEVMAELIALFGWRPNSPTPGAEPGEVRS